MRINRSIIGLFIAVLLVVGVIIVGVNISRRGKVPFRLTIIPKEAVITINEQKTGQGVLYLSPGEYTIVTKHEDFDTSTITKNLTKSGELSLVLTPVNQAGRKLLKKYDEEILELERKAGLDAQKEGQELTDKNPLLRELPYSTSYYSINYRLAEGNSGRVVVEIGGGGALGRQVALEKIRNWGFKLGDYEIVFVDFDNPFMARESSSE